MPLPTPLLERVAQTTRAGLSQVATPPGPSSAPSQAAASGVGLLGSSKAPAAKSGKKDRPPTVWGGGPAERARYLREFPPLTPEGESPSLSEEQVQEVTEVKVADVADCATLRKLWNNFRGGMLATVNDRSSPSPQGGVHQWQLEVVGGYMGTLLNPMKEGWDGLVALRARVRQATSQLIQGPPSEKRMEMMGALVGMIPRIEEEFASLRVLLREAQQVLAQCPDLLLGVRCRCPAYIDILDLAGPTDEVVVPKP